MPTIIIDPATAAVAQFKCFLLSRCEPLSMVAAGVTAASLRLPLELQDSAAHHPLNLCVTNAAYDVLSVGTELVAALQTFAVSSGLHSVAAHIHVTRMMHRARDEGEPELVRDAVLLRMDGRTPLALIYAAPGVPTEMVCNVILRDLLVMEGATMMATVVSATQKHLVHALQHGIDPIAAHIALWRLNTVTPSSHARAAADVMVGAAGTVAAETAAVTAAETTAAVTAAETTTTVAAVETTTTVAAVETTTTGGAGLAVGGAGLAVGGAGMVVGGAGLAVSVDKEAHSAWGDEPSPPRAAAESNRAATACRGEGGGDTWARRVGGRGSSDSWRTTLL